ncbi:MAG: cytochrome c oxidase subunit II [Alphaproteobacteria bacterium]|nr:MAG: cytochrome c oxidase subunit II [Alphaproteobacteria bacterium]
MAIKRVLSVVAVPFALWAMTAAALAQEMVGAPRDGEIGLQPAASPIAHQIHGFYDLLLVIILSVVAVVGLLLLWVIIRYNRKANPTPSKVTHNTLLEVVWTTIPVIILVLIAVPSFRLLYAEDVVPPADLVVKVTGHQWYWTYEYPDLDGITFDAIMIPERLFDDPAAASEREEAARQVAAFLGRDKPVKLHRLLDTDTRLVVPVGKVVKVQVTSTDVIHSWAVPAFGVKIDAIPGRLNESWFKAEKTGTFYGQCSELCGQRHAFMPIAIEVVSQEEFDRWVKKAKAEYGMAAADEAARPLRLAAR